MTPTTPPGSGGETPEPGYKPEKEVRMIVSGNCCPEHHWMADKGA
ncbi:hypothetical protein [Alistipes montrealensis]|nr:hypothetical protein [Alistipes montrealensis]